MNLPAAAPLAGLLWFPEHDMGFYPVHGSNGNGHNPYNAAYFEKYQGYALTDQGKQILWARLGLVERWWKYSTLIDVGIGCGAFVEARLRSAKTYGWDVNPVAVDWLQERGLLLDPEAGPFVAPIAMSFWDSLEHIENPDPLLANATWAFCSLPIFENADHVLRSRHFRRDEHYWYWTRRGLVQWFAQRGFRCREHNTAESLLGREDIHTFAFERVPPP